MKKLSTRHEDKALVQAFKKLSCNACLYKGNNDAHHIKTRGSGGGDYDWNLVTLCRSCHGSIHRLGVKAFANKWHIFKEVLISKGWAYWEVLA